MGGEQIKVLVVDDSTVIRGMLAKVLEDDPAIKFVATAANGELALKHLSRMPVDVVTLDVEMPIMDGLTTLHEIVSKYPAIKVIMVSSKTEKGAKTTLDAMAAGAADFVPKPAANREGDSVRELRDELIAKIHTLSGVLPATAQQAATGNSAGAAPRRNRPANVRPEILVIGSSTGGPNALPVVLRGLSPDFKLPILIVQHMPPVFTRQLAIQLEDACGRPCSASTAGW